MRKEIFLSLLLGFLLDCLLGDPHSIPHPVVAIGKLISGLEKLLRGIFPKTRAGEMTAGGILWVLTVAVSFCVPLAILRLCGLVSPWLRLIVSSIMSWQVLAAKSLKTESMKVYTALEKYFPSWVGYNMAKCGGCIRACVSMLEKKGGCMEGRFREPLRHEKKAWKMDR